MTRDIFTGTHLTDIPSETVCAFLRRLAGTPPGVPRTMVLDNARYPRGALGHSVAPSLGIEWQCLPPYAPTLNLMERFWQCVKKTGLYSKYYADAVAFQHAILASIEQSSPTYRKELESLLPLKLQTVKEVQVLGEASNICLFPVVKKAQRKVSSKAA